MFIQSGREVVQRQFSNGDAGELKAAGINQIHQFASEGFAGSHHVDQIATAA
jgi:hypothetical protein